MELMVLASLIGLVLGLIVFARAQKNRRLKINTEESALEVVPSPSSDLQGELIDGSILEFPKFFLKADCEGYIVTKEGDLSIEFFKNKELRLVQTDIEECLRQKQQDYVETSQGSIHRKHFVPKQKRA